MSEELENVFAGSAATTHIHGCLIYDDLDCYRDMALSFIRGGLLAQEKCIMAVHRYTRSMIESDFRNAGLKISQFLKDGSLTILDARELYNDFECFDIETIIHFWAKEVDRAIGQNFSGLRVIGEASFSDRYADFDDKLVHYENLLNEQTFPDFPVKSLCVYDKSHASAAMLKGVIKAHPVLIYNKEIFRENIHYVPPEVFFTTEDKDGQEVECWLANLSRNNANIQTLRENEKRFRKLFRNAPLGYQSLDSHGNFIEVNQQWLKVMGYSHEEVIGRNFAEFLHPEWQAHFRENFPRFKAVGEILGVEFEMVKKDGSTILVTFNGKISRSEDGSFLQTHCVLEDITTQRRRQDEFHKQQQIISLNNRIANTFLTSAKEDLFNDVLDHILDTLESRFGYFGYIDDQGNLICPSLTRDVWESCNVEDKDIVFPREKWAGLWGRSLLELKPLIANEGLQTPDGHIQMDCAMAVPILHRGILIGQFVVANKPGGFQEFDLELLEKAAAQTGPILFGLLEGERQRKEKIMLEQQYLQAQKMESVGRLAGGIAHDLNNMLAPILGYGEILAEDLGMDDPRYHSARQIVEAGMRAGTMVRQLLAFSRKQTLEFKQVNLNSLLNNFEHLLRRTIREDIVIDFILADSVPSIRGDIGQLEQVIMNLSVNAQDAIPGDGIMVFETEVVDIDKSYYASHDSIPPGKYVMLAVSDTGMGMDGETQAQIFEPFFTTKGEHKGTGLGMATVYGIIKQHDGFISVYSEQGEGTTIKVYLPVSSDSQGATEEHREAAKIKGTETVLLVEDDERVGRTVQDMLQRSGYNVTTARNGKEALQRLATDGDSLALLITDIVMPEMDGRSLAEIVQQEYPEMKILFMSGYSDDVISRRGIFKKGVNFIHKPFTAHMLLTKVREALLN